MMIVSIVFTHIYMSILTLDTGGDAKDATTIVSMIMMGHHHHHHHHHHLHFNTDDRN